MNAPLRTPIRFDVHGLVAAIAQNTTDDVFKPAITPQQWEVLGTYLQPFALNNGQVLIEQNANDRTVYIVESGSLTVHYQDTKGRLRLAAVGPGSAVGEGAIWLKDGITCIVTLWNGVPLVVTPPPHIELKIVETDPGLRGDTATGGQKPAKLETGAVVRVPLFLNEGEVVKVDTRTGEYISRAKQ